MREKGRRAADGQALGAAQKWGNPGQHSAQKETPERRVEADQNHLPTPDGWHGSSPESRADPRWARWRETGLWQESFRRQGNALGSGVPIPPPQSWPNDIPPAPTHQDPVALHSWRQGSSVQTCPRHCEQVSAEHPLRSPSRWHVWLAGAHSHHGKLRRAEPASSLP